jgi:hypothetical protein
MARPPIPAPNPEYLWKKAHGFEKASVAIHNKAYDFLSKDKNEDLDFAMTVAAFVNHVFSFELYLKCLTAIEFGYFYAGHDLLRLFNELPQSTKDEIIDTHNSTVINRPITQGIPTSGDLIKSLTEASNVFEEYRYLDNENISDYYDLGTSILYVKKAIIKRRPSYQV